MQSKNNFGRGSDPLQCLWRKAIGASTLCSRFFTSRLATWYLRLWGVECGPGLRIDSLPLCRRDPQARIILGRGVRLVNNILGNLAGVTHRCVLVADRPGATLCVGNHVGLSGVILYCTTSIVIEDFVLLGANVRVYDTDFHPLEAAARRRKVVGAIRCAPVRIGRDVWIGADATVLKGVTIGARSVVAAGAVVTHDVPRDTLVAGVAARAIRMIPGSGEER
jgi:hypothetical protein